MYTYTLYIFHSSFVFSIAPAHFTSAMQALLYISPAFIFSIAPARLGLPVQALLYISLHLHIFNRPRGSAHFTSASCFVLRSVEYKMELLPDELVCECLVRVPYTSHGNLKGVCRRWKGIVRGPYFYADRNIAGKSDQLICLIQKDNKKTSQRRSVFVITIYDPLNETWKRLNTH